MPNSSVPPRALVLRCQEHKRRNVLEHLPESLQASVARALRDAWSSEDVELARKQLQRLVASLQAQHPGAAASLREGLDETLTVQGLGITEALYRTLRTTNPIKNLNGSVAHYTRNVKRWQDGQMTLRWVASALSDASGRFRKLRGHRPEAELASFEFRAIRPLFAGRPFQLCAEPQEDGQRIHLWARDQAGALAMDATAVLRVK